MIREILEISEHELKIGDYVLLGHCEKSMRPEIGEVLEKCGLFKIKEILGDRIYIDPTRIQESYILSKRMNPYTDRFKERIKRIFVEIDNDEEILTII